MIFGISFHQVRRTLQADLMNTVMEAVSSDRSENAQAAMVMEVIPRGQLLMDRTTKQLLESILLAEASSRPDSVYKYAALAPALCANTDEYAFYSLFLSYVHLHAKIITEYSNLNNFGTGAVFSTQGSQPNYYNAQLTKAWGTR